MMSPSVRRLAVLSLVLASSLGGSLRSAAAENGLLFYLSGEKGTTADFSAAGTPVPTFDAEITKIPDGAKGAALSCSDTQALAYRAPGNIYAQRGTLSLFWRSRYPVGPTAFPIFRVGYGDHSSWDMCFLRIDYNGHGFDAYVTDISLARTRVSVALDSFPQPNEWVHLTLAWDETRGIRFYVNGRLAAKNETQAVYNAALDQFGPHSRIIGPWHVQSDYNYVRGGDIDEVRIYDRMVDDADAATLARGEGLTGLPALPARDLADARWRDEWRLRYGFNRPGDLPPELPAGRDVSVRKVEIHDAYDLKRWYWKALDGIPETTWPGVYNRSRLPGRNDYFQLPDWDCYVDSGKAVTFLMPDEPWNQLEISGAAWGRMELLPPNTAGETASDARAESLLFNRPQGQEKTVHRLEAPLTGRQIRFTNVAQEEPIGALSAYYVTAGRESAGSAKLSYEFSPGVVPDGQGTAALREFIAGRFAPDERSILVAQPAGAGGDRGWRIHGRAAAHRAPLDSGYVGPAHRRTRRDSDRPPGARCEDRARRAPPAQYPGERPALAHAQHGRLHLQREAGRGQDPLARPAGPAPAGEEGPLAYAGRRRGRSPAVPGRQGPPGLQAARGRAGRARGGPLHPDEGQLRDAGGGASEQPEVQYLEPLQGRPAGPAAG